jgi:hypothetical protein
MHFSTNKKLFPKISQIIISPSEKYSANSSTDVEVLIEFSLRKENNSK